MGQLPSKVNVSVAVPNKSKKVYSQCHLTTHQFMRPRPIFSREYIPGRNMNVTIDSIIRANPMPVPIFGHAKVHNRAFFVPFRAVARDFNAFYTSTVFNYDSAHGGSRVPYDVPHTSNLNFVRWFISTIGTNDPALESGSASDYDVVYYDDSQTPATTTYYKFTALGIHYISVLESLGYKLNWRASDTKIMSALPLMCYAKVMVDWYYPSAYVGSTAYNACQELFNNPFYNHTLNNTEINSLMYVTQVITYNPDYFVNAWDTPTAPNSGSVERQIGINDVTNNATNLQLVTNDASVAGSPSVSSYKPSNGTPFVGSTAGSNSYAHGVTTQYIIDALKSLTDYTKRHAISGVRVLDRYLSELGVNLSAEILNRSMYIGSQEFDMEFFDVYSHAATTDAALGAYAGKGNGFSGKKTFDFEGGQEFGMFIIVNSIIPVIGYYQGQNKETLHVYALDFYHGDFDHMSVQPISAREVFVSQDGSLPISDSSLNQHIFGFSPKYIEYNIPQDVQTGLYRIRTRNGLLPMYSLMRDLSSYENGTSVNVITHSNGFVQGFDATQFNRIFGVTGKQALEDQFNAVHNFEVVNYDSTLPAYDTYDFDEKNKNVTLDVNGSKLN